MLHTIQIHAYRFCPHFGRPESSATNQGVKRSNVRFYERALAISLTSTSCRNGITGAFMGTYTIHDVKTAKEGRKRPCQLEMP
jgi:hypothetical protein